MTNKSGHSDHIPGTFVFTGQRSKQGLKLNRFAYSMNQADNRTAFLENPTAFMESYDLSKWEIERVLKKDWKSLIEQGGGNIYMLAKVGSLMGDGLTALGAQQRGETNEEFMKTRNVPLRENT